LPRAALADKIECQMIDAALDAWKIDQTDHGQWLPRGRDWIATSATIPTAKKTRMRFLIAQLATARR